MPKWGYVAIVLGLAGAAYVVWQHNHTPSNADTVPKAAAPVPVRVIQAARQNTPVYVNGIGNVAPLNQVVIRSRIDGELTHVHFTEGQSVKAGELLAEIDARAIQAELARAQAEKASNQAQLTNARLNLKRYANLLKDDAIARQTVDQEEATVRQLEAAVQMSEATIQTARVQLSYTRITAPIAGYVGIRNVDIGNIVRATDVAGLLTITQITPISVFFTLPQTDLDAVLPLMTRADRPVDILAKDGKAILATGRLQAIDNQIDPTTGTVRLKAISPNTAHALWPGQFVVVRVQTRVLKDKIVLPLTAVQRAQNRAFVYRVTPDNTAEQRDVTILLEQAETVVLDGLEPGDRIVTDGQSRLKPGSAVTVLDTPSADDPASSEDQPAAASQAGS